MKHSRNILNQISKYVELQSMEFELKKTDLEKAIHNKIKDLSDFKINMYMDESIDEELYVERNVLDIALSELLENAKKHTRTKRIDIRPNYMTDKEDKLKSIQIAIKDFGSGIDFERQDYIYNGITCL